MDLLARKDTVRRTTLARRARLPEAERAPRAAAIVRALLFLPEVSSARSVLAFVPHLSEPPIVAFLEGVLDAGKSLLLPYVAEDGALRASEVGALSELKPGYRGIPEPRARLPVDAADVDVVVVPGVAFDAEGRRLGYGGGFYDSFLRACGDVTRVGVCFELQIVDEVPIGEHDESVDIVVTDEHVRRTGRRTSPIH